MRGVRLRRREIIEIIDLYRWGAPMRDIVDLYDIHKTTVKDCLKRNGVPMRRNGAPTVANPKPHPETKLVKSSRPQIPAGARVVDECQGPFQLLRSSARAQLDKRTAERQLGESIGSCRAEASVSRSASSHSDSLLRARG